MPRPPIRVMIVVGQLRLGGAERQVHELVSRLDRSRFLPTVVTFEPGGHYEPLIQAAGVQVVVIDKRGWRETAAPLRLAALMRRLGTNVVHAFLFPAYWRSLLAAGMIGGRPVACAVRSVRIWEKARLRLMDAAALRRATVILGNAPAVRDHVIRQAGVPPERVRVIMNGVDTALFRPGPSPLRASWSAAAAGDAPIVGFAGSFRQAKDPMLFVRIAGQVARRLPRASFVMVGDGPLRGRLEEAARAEGLNGRIVLTGERADMPDVLRALDLLAVTSEREGCCNVILEAMATGLPVAATAVGGNPDLVGEGATGRLFPHGDVGAGAEAVAGILGDQEARARMASTALARARQSFSIEAMVRATASLYEELA